MANFLLELEANVRTLIMIFIGLVYLFLGAAVFSAIEKNHEAERKVELMAEVRMVKEMFNMTDEDFRNLTRIALELQPHKAGTQWSFVGALYFAITVVTTIGYGHSVPQTSTGKIFCMIYATVGIPICLIMFQAMGERINNAAKFCLKAAGHKLGFKFDEISHRCLVPFGIFSCVLTVVVGSTSFAAFEDWSYIDSVYYCVMTLSTIGFGDYVALQDDGDLQERPHYVAFSLIYIMIGLTVIGAFLNLVILRMMVTLPDTPEGSTNGDKESIDQRVYSSGSLQVTDDYRSCDDVSSHYGSDYGRGPGRRKSRALKKSVRDYLYRDAEQGKQRQPLKLAKFCRMSKRKKFERNWKRKNNCGTHGDSSSDESTTSERPTRSGAVVHNNNVSSNSFKRISGQRSSQRLDNHQLCRDGRLDMDRCVNKWSDDTCTCVSCSCVNCLNQRRGRQQADAVRKISMTSESDAHETRGKSGNLEVFSFSDGKLHVTTNRRTRAVSDDSGYSPNHPHDNNIMSTSQASAFREVSATALNGADCGGPSTTSTSKLHSQVAAKGTAQKQQRPPSPLLKHNSDPVVVFNKTGAGKTLTIRTRGRFGSNSSSTPTSPVGEKRTGEKASFSDAECARLTEIPAQHKCLKRLAGERPATPPLLRQDGFSDPVRPSIVVTSCSPKIQRASDSLSHQDSNETTVTLLTATSDQDETGEQHLGQSDHKHTNQVKTPPMTRLQKHNDVTHPVQSCASSPPRGATDQLCDVKNTNCRCGACTQAQSSRMVTLDSDSTHQRHHAAKKFRKTQRFPRRPARDGPKTTSPEAVQKKRSWWNLPVFQLFTSTRRKSNVSSPRIAFRSIESESGGEDGELMSKSRSRKAEIQFSGRKPNFALETLNENARKPTVGSQTKLCSLATFDDDFDTASLSSLTSLSSYVGNKTFEVRKGGDMC